MEARRATRIEAVADISAATVFALAIAAGAYRLGLSPAIGALAAVLGGVAGWRILALVQAETPTFLLEFEPGTLPEVEQPDELILTDADLYAPPAEREAQAVSEGDDTLVLDDVLARIDEGSRVVRLFDPAAMPTPGQLRSRIDRHLASSISPGTPPDASKELHDALAELRRTLR